MSELRADHLDLDALADHLAGELDATLHLEVCGGCTARLAELQAGEQMVLAALAALPAPPVPATVADRISAALAAEPALSAAAAPAGGRTGATTGGVLHLSERAPERRRTWLPAAAAGVVLVAGGLIGYSLVAGGGASNDATTASSDSAGAAAGSELAPASQVPALSSGLDYADAPAVAATLPRVLAGDATEGSAPLTGAAADALAPLREPAALDDCLTALLPDEQPDLQPVALDFATYDGAPALAVVLPDPDPAKLSVFVVGAGCSQADDDLRFFIRVDRP